MVIFLWLNMVPLTLSLVFPFRVNIEGMIAEKHHGSCCKLLFTFWMICLAYGITICDQGGHISLGIVYCIALLSQKFLQVRVLPVILIHI
jgi:hypothetical protein